MSNATPFRRPYGETVPSAIDLIDDYRDRFRQLGDRFGVPGATVGISVDGNQAYDAWGTTNVRTGVEVNPDTLFQIGSISKVYTATAALRLVARGELDLDTPVRTYLTDLRLGDPDTAARVTTRHLLTHTSGIEGDIFEDTGRGDDCLARYVEGLGRAAQRQALGTRFSYCNAGFVLLGHLLERLTGRTWDEVIAAEVVRPLGLESTITLPEEALFFRTAVGHQPGASGAMTPTQVWTYPRSLGPAGLICSTAANLLAFAEAHLADGRGATEAQLLPPQLSVAMREREIDLPAGWPGAEWGLGWIRYDWNGLLAVGHDGGTIGQRALLRLVPERGIAIAVLTNSTTGALMARRVVREVMARLDVAVPEMPAPLAMPLEPTALTRHVGTYSRLGETIKVHLSGTSLSATVRSGVSDVAPPVSTEVSLEPIDGNRFLLRTHGEPDALFVFGGEQGRSDWLYNGRINHRVQVSSR